MAYNRITALTAATMALFLAGQAQALTLTNRDLVEQRLVITEEGEEVATRDVVIEGNQTLDQFCEAGCTIALENGEQESFEGDENVVIQDGRLVILE